MTYCDVRLVACLTLFVFFGSGSSANSTAQELTESRRIDGDVSDGDYMTALSYGLERWRDGEKQDSVEEWFLQCSSLFRDDDTDDYCILTRTVFPRLTLESPRRISGPEIRRVRHDSREDNQIQLIKNWEAGRITLIIEDFNRHFSFLESVGSFNARRSRRTDSLHPFADYSGDTGTYQLSFEFDYDLEAEYMYLRGFQGASLTSDTPIEYRIPEYSYMHNVPLRGFRER